MPLPTGAQSPRSLNRNPLRIQDIFEFETEMEAMLHAFNTFVKGERRATNGFGSYLGLPATDRCCRNPTSDQSIRPRIRSTDRRGSPRAKCPLDVDTENFDGLLDDLQRKCHTP